MVDNQSTELVVDSASAAEAPPALTVASDLSKPGRDVRSAGSGDARNLRTVMERSPTWVAVILGDRLRYANPAFCTLLGYGPDELTGRDLYSVVHPEERTSMTRQVEQATAGGPSSPSMPRRLLRKDGSITKVEITDMAPIEFDNEPAVLMVGVDISERRRLEAQLVFADRMASMGTLAAGVAHEINNPLAYAIANLDLLVRDLGQLEDECRSLAVNVAEKLRRMRELLGAAREGSERVRVIVRDLKTFSRGDEDSLCAVDLRRMLDASVALAWNEIKHRARLVRDYGDLPAVHGNEARLGQLFLNLLLNAAQAIPEGQADQNEIRIVGRAHDGNRVIIEVRDTGVGIPAEHLPRIFDPFFTTKPVGVGTGLGLFICRGIVGALNGEITVESTVGAGTAFRVSLPQALGDFVEATLPAARSEQAAGLRGRVLVVDDEEMLVVALQEALREHDVVIETEGQAALARLMGGERFDLVLCDLMMPEMSGMELYLRTRTLAPEQAERFVFMTGGAFTPKSREFLAGVPNLRIEKPFDLPHLLTLVRDQLSDHAGATP